MVEQSDFLPCACGHAYEDHATIVDGQLITGACRQSDCDCIEPHHNGLPDNVRSRWVFDVEKDGSVSSPTIEGTWFESDGLTIAEHLMREYSARAEANGENAQGPVMAADMLARFQSIKG